MKGLGLAAVLLLAACGETTAPRTATSVAPRTVSSPTPSPVPSPLPPCGQAEVTLVDLKGGDNGQLPAASAPFYPCYDIDRNTGHLFNQFTVRLDWNCGTDQSTDVVAIVENPDGSQAYSPSVESNSAASGSLTQSYNVPLQPKHLKLAVVDQGCTFHVVVRGHSY